MTSAPDIIYVVHGSHAHTWWRRLANRGYPWWRRWSLFCCAVRQTFGKECDIREFRWSGKNTAQARREAGDELAQLIARDSSQRKVHVIGHSHGGNVALAAVNRLPHQRVESVILLANPNIALLDSRGQPPQWLYWGETPERVGRIWNLYSPEDPVQGKLVEWFHGIPNRGRKIVLTRRRYPGTERNPVHNVEIHWSHRRSAHHSMHSEIMGLFVGALLKGAAIPEAMKIAGLSMEKNSTHDRGGWPGTGRTFEMLRKLADPQPFDFGSSAGGVGVLFVHGFTASPAEVRPMAQVTAQSTGWRCKGFLLPGHGTRVEDMAQTDSESWVKAVQREYETLSRECDHVFLVGLSSRDSEPSGFIFCGPCTTSQARAGAHPTISSTTACIPICIFR
jgi:pimeloyl-ACP methyl ester carboxylesterase